jgi:hypothetical protein
MAATFPQKNHRTKNNLIVSLEKTPTSANKFCSYLIAGEGQGGASSDDWSKSLALCILCGPIHVKNDSTTRRVGESMTPHLAESGSKRLSDSPRRGVFF